MNTAAEYVTKWLNSLPSKLHTKFIFSLYKVK